MDFKNCEAFVIPFSVPEASVWKKVIEYLCEKETTPIESICNSHVVSIDKEYYPVQRLEINYTAKWNAISIFKEYWTEQETHYEQQIRFFDRLGIEHKHSGFDYFDPKSGKWKSGAFNPIGSRIKGYSGNANTRQWMPKEVTVPVTENVSYERETGRKRNFGEIKGNQIYFHDKEYPFRMDLKTLFPNLFSGIFSDSDLTANGKISYSKEAVKDGKVIEQLKPINERDYDSALSVAKSNAKNQCIGQIPGQEYADFHMEFDSNDVCQMWYYPVYHVNYEFRGQKYECFVSGYGDASVKGKNDPEDASIESIKQQYDTQCSNLKDRKKKCLLEFVGLCLGICAASILLIPLIGLDMLISTGITGAIIFLVLSIPLVGVVVYLCKKKYEELNDLKEEITKIEEAKKNIVPIRQAKKRAIMDVILNDNLSDSEKAMKCEAILNNNTDYQ